MSQVRLEDRRCPLTAMALGSVFGKTGWGEWFPWSIIPLMIGTVGQPVASLPASSYVVLGLTFALGVAVTIAKVRYADNVQ